jgi:hypothetical protein
MKLSVGLCLVVAVLGCHESAPATLTPQEALSQDYRALEDVLRGLARNSADWRRVASSLASWRASQKTARAQLTTEASPARAEVLALLDTERQLGEAISLAMGSIEALQASLGDKKRTSSAKLERYQVALARLAALEESFARWGTSETTALASLKEQGVVVEPLYPTYRHKIEANLAKLSEEIQNLKSMMEKMLGAPAAKP